MRSHHLGFAFSFPKQVELYLESEASRQPMCRYDGTDVYARKAGQFVLVYEAINLSIAIYNMRQGEGIRYETLFRDETVGALDATNAKEYVRMLRRAMDLGGFRQVIFICHTPLVWELTDRILSVGGGCVVMPN